MKKSIIAALVVFGAVSAHAATVSYQYGLPIAQATTEIGQTGSLGLFDSSLGTLTGAALTIEGAATFAFSGANNSAQAQLARITSSTELLWSSSLAAINPFLNVFTLSATSGFQSYAVGETKNFGPFNVSDSQVDNLSSILSSLQLAGGGNFDLTCNSLSGLTVAGGGGNISTTQATTAGCGASIVYEYTERTTQVPEPGSLALMGLALSGLFVAAKRRKA